MTRSVLLSLTSLLVLSCATVATPPPASAPAPAAPAEPQVEIERISDSTDLSAGQTIRVTNPHGDVRARFGGYEGHMEILANVQQLRPDGVLLDVALVADGDGASVTVGYPEGSAPPPPDDRSRADIAVLVPEHVTLEVATDRGLIEASGLQSDLVARTRKGDVSIKKSTGHVDARTESGTILVTFDPATAGPAQNLESTVGNITVYLPETANADIVAETSGDICTDFSVTIDHRRDAEPSKRAVAKIGAGGRGYVIRTLRGNVGLFRLQKIFERAGGGESAPHEAEIDSDAD